MKISFVANFMNHHQLPFSHELQKLTGNNYTFISFDPINQERLSLGYEDMNQLPFVIRAYENSTEYKKAVEKILNDDMVIFGSCPNEMLDMRAQTKKPYIIYSERFFKKGTYRRFIPITRKKIYDRCTKHQQDNVSIIAASAFLSYDLNLLNVNFQIYKWGYFPKCESYENINSIIDNKPNASILWVGRFIKSKNPELPIKIAKLLKKDGYNFTFNMIGTGPMKPKLRKLIKKYKLEDCVKILGSMSPQEVRKYMCESSVFLFTSNQQEGWGAVLNESMNSGCAVIASNAIGSVPFLLKNKLNGLIYRAGDISNLYDNVKFLLDNPEKRKELGLQAYNTITTSWSAENATQRLYSIIEAIVNNSTLPNYTDGPCSTAPIIKPASEELL